MLALLKAPELTQLSYASQDHRPENAAAYDELAPPISVNKKDTPQRYLPGQSDAGNPSTDTSVSGVMLESPARELLMSGFGSPSVFC